MKIEDVKLGRRYKSASGKVGVATGTLWNGGPDRSDVQLTGDIGSQWFEARNIEPVDESPKEVTPKDTMSDESLKIEDLRIGMLVDCVANLVHGHHSSVGGIIREIVFNDDDPDLSHAKVLGCKTTYGAEPAIVHISDIRRHVPVDESPKKAHVQIGASPTPISITATPPQASIGMATNDREPLMQFRKQGQQLSLADTPVSQMTIRQALILQGFGGWLANPDVLPDDCTDVIGMADELITEMAKVKS